jgi:hypothetical protein
MNPEACSSMRRSSNSTTGRFTPGSMSPGSSCLRTTTPAFRRVRQVERLAQRSLFGDGPAVSPLDRVPLLDQEGLP